MTIAIMYIWFGAVVCWYAETNKVSPKIYMPKTLDARIIRVLTWPYGIYVMRDKL